MTDDYLQFVVDQLSEIGDVQIQKVFGQGLLLMGGVVFGYIIDYTLYFKVDETNKRDYESAGGACWVASDKSWARRSYEKCRRLLPTPSMVNRTIGTLSDSEGCGCPTSPTGRCPRRRSPCR